MYRADTSGIHVRALLSPSHEVSQVCQISVTGMAAVTIDVRAAL